jgi:hypothetical protein
LATGDVFTGSFNLAAAWTLQQWQGLLLHAALQRQLGDQSPGLKTQQWQLGHRPSYELLFQNSMLEGMGSKKSWNSTNQVEFENDGI